MPTSMLHEEFRCWNFVRQLCICTFFCEKLIQYKIYFIKSKSITERLISIVPALLLILLFVPPAFQDERPNPCVSVGGGFSCGNGSSRPPAQVGYTVYMRLSKVYLIPTRVLGTNSVE